MAKLWFLIERFGRTLRVFAVAALVILVPREALSSEEYRAWPGEFLRMGAGARALGMGNAYAAVEGDIYSSYFNPAGLAAMEEKELALSVRYLGMDRRFMHLAYGGRIGPDADFAISWIQAGTDDIIGRDLNGSPTGSLEDKRNGIWVTFSKDAGRWFSFGMNAKLSLWKLAGEDARAYGFDFGAMARPMRNLSLSFVMRDINSRYTWKTKSWNKKMSGADGQPMEKRDDFPLYYTLGFAYKIYQERLLFSFSMENVQDNPIGYNAGMSYRLNDRLTMRMGMYQYTRENAVDYGSYTYGFTVRISNSLVCDYAYVPDDFMNDDINSFSIVMNYGE